MTPPPPTVEELRASLAAHHPDAAAAAGAASVVRAPGRVNLIGEHTDYNDGWVLPAAIDLEIRLCFVPTDDRRVELTRLDLDEQGGFELGDRPARTGGWIDYPAGVAWALAEAGVAVRGLRGVISSDLPIGSGLSSSAALELAAAWGMAAELPPLPGMELAKVCQRAENEHVGVRSGIMDQAAVALGRAGHAILLDCRSLDVEPVPLPGGGVRLVVCDSRVPRELAASAYNDRRAECERAVAALQAAGEPVRSLRDAHAGMLRRHEESLDSVARQRAWHVVSENARVLETVDALRAGDLDTVARAMRESHRSLRDRYEVSSPELDALVEIAGSTPGVIAARMTGAGFGGCTVNLVRDDAVEALRDALEREYPERTGREAGVMVVEAADGAGML